MGDDQPTGFKARIKKYRESHKAFHWLLNVYEFLLSQWFFCLLGVFIALAYEFPNFARQGGLIKGEYTIGYGAVAIIFLISGLSMSTRDLMVNALHWRVHFTVLSLSFLITSSIIYGIALGIKAANDGEIDPWLLVGLIVTHACPTTVSSNVVMTRQAHGNVVLTLCEVFIGNVLGAFITPALVQMYLTGTWEFGNPLHQVLAAQDVQVSIGQLYKNVMKQIGLSVFVPLFVGQVIQNIFPKQTKWTLTTFRLNKVGSFMLLLIMFLSFSTAFYQNAFNDVSHVSIIFICFFNVGIYLFFTVLSFCYSRPRFLLAVFREPITESSSRLYRYSYKLFRPFYYNRKDTVSVMLCGPAKTAALGVSLISSQYGAHNPNLGILLVPLVLYQAEQVMTANFLTHLMKKWVLNGELEDQKLNQELLAAQTAGKITDEEATIGIEEEEQPHDQDTSSTRSRSNASISDDVPSKT
ncbi:Solute carrier rch1 [Scheffersomyces spartinae]|uniref:Solute carrier rch1 n=1 Tax=Scheffersomyces spartinae TaxID=45513 RepID=A0A9P7V959_9ASCO|nr:Solute carrier rch1 [Scheffersomyces spartinae]KAG7193517.1 Solute carrier rch1 [Scheffersomyces spartinae]